MYNFVSLVVVTLYIVTTDNTRGKMLWMSTKSGWLPLCIVYKYALLVYIPLVMPDG